MVEYQGYRGKNSDLLKSLNTASKRLADETAKKKKDEEDKKKKQVAFGDTPTDTSQIESATKELNKKSAVSGGNDFWSGVGGFLGDAGRVVGDIAKSATEHYNTLGTGLGTALGEITGVNQKMQDTVDKSLKESNDVVSKLNKQLQEPGISDERKKKIQDTIVKIRTIDESQTKGASDEFKKQQEATDPLKNLAAAGEVGLDIATAGAGGAIFKGVKGSTKAAGKAAESGLKISKRGDTAKRAVNAIVSPTGIKQGAASGSVIGASYGGLDAVRREGSDVTAGDIASGVAIGAAGGAALGAALPAIGGAISKAISKKTKNAIEQASVDPASIDEKTINDAVAELDSIKAKDAEEANAIAASKQGLLAAVKARNARNVAQDDYSKQEYDTIQANRAAGLNDDGSKFVNVDETKKQINDMQSGNYSDDLYDTTKPDGTPADQQFIQEATQKQLDILRQRRDEIAAQVDAIESPAARELAMQNVNKLDDQIAAISSGDSSALMDVGDTGLTRTLNTDRVRERFNQLNKDLEYGTSRENQARLDAQKRDAPTRTFDQVSKEADALGAGGIAPEAVTPASDFKGVDDVIVSPNIPEQIKLRATSLSEDMNKLQLEKSALMTKQKSNAMLDELDNRFMEDSIKIERMPEPRRTDELDRIQSEYNAAYAQIRDKEKADSDAVLNVTRIEEQIQANMNEVLADANLLKNNNPTLFGTVDEELNKKIAKEVEQETETAIFNRMSNEEGVPDSQNVSKAWTKATDKKIEEGLTSPQVGAMAAESIKDTFTNDGVKVYGDSARAIDSTYAALAASSASHNMEKIFGKTGVELFGRIVKAYAHVSKANERVAKDLTSIKKAFGGDKTLYARAVDVLEGRDVDTSSFNKAQVEAVNKLRGMYEYGGRQVRKLAYRDTVHAFERRQSNGKIGYTGSEIKQFAKRDGITMKEAEAKYKDITEFKNRDIEFLANKAAEKATIDNYYPHMFDKDGKEVNLPDNEYVRSNGDVKFGNMLHRLSSEDNYSRDIIDVSSRYFAALNKKTFLEPELQQIDNAKLAIKAADSDANSVYKWLDKYQAQLKYNKEDIVGKSYNEMIDKVISKKNPNSKKIGENHYRKLMSTQRQVNAMAALGLSFRNAIQQTTQIGTTIGNIGAKNTVVGMVKYLSKSLNPTTHKQYTDLLDEHGITHAGIAREAFSELQNDGTSGRFRTAGNKMADTLMIMTSKMDEFARGSAYEGILHDSLKNGMSRKEAEVLATAGAAKYNFMTSKVDMPLALNGDTVRSLSQFMTFSYKQVEAWKDLGIKAVKNPETGKYQLNPKQMGRILQMVAFYGVTFEAMSQVAGIDPEDNIPFYGNIFGDSGLPKSPIISTLFGRTNSPGLLEIVSGVVSPDGNNSFEKEQSRQEMLGNLTDLMVKNFVPAGSQATKSVTGVGSTLNDGVVEKDGQVRFMQNTDLSTQLQAGLFGQYSTEPGQEWVDKKFPTLSEKESEILNQQKDKESKKRAYDFYSSLKGAQRKGVITPNIKDLIQTEPNKAKRLIQEHNKQVQKSIDEYTSKYGGLSEYEQEYIIDNYLITNGNVDNMAEEDNG